MQVLFVEPGKTPEARAISGDLVSMQELVGGMIQAVYPFDEPMALICNDEGKLLGMEMNRMLPEIGDVICGPFFLCGAPPDSEEFTSLSLEQLERCTARFQSIELIVSAGDTIFVLKV